MDYPENQRDFNKRIEREVSRLERMMEQELARRVALVGQRQNPRLARTIEDPNATPTYPAHGSTVFPAVFLSGGFTNTAGTQTGQYTPHREVLQCKVFTISGRYIPEDTVIQVWQDIGTDATYKGHWWTDYGGRGMRLGKPDSGISASSTGTVSIYSGVDHTDTSVNVTAYAIIALDAGKWVSVEEIDGVQHAFKIEC
jgi:hypothetical protein